ARGERDGAARPAAGGQLARPARGRLLQQRQLPLARGEPCGELVLQGAVDLGVGIAALGRAEEARAPGPQRRIGREVAAVREVPGEGPDYDATVTSHFLTGNELTADELRSLLDRALDVKADRG